MDRGGTSVVSLPGNMNMNMKRQLAGRSPGTLNPGNAAHAEGSTHPELSRFSKRTRHRGQDRYPGTPPNRRGQTDRVTDIVRPEGHQSHLSGQLGVAHPTHTTLYTSLRGPRSRSRHGLVVKCYETALCKVHSREGDLSLMIRIKGRLIATAAMA